MATSPNYHNVFVEAQPEDALFHSYREQTRAMVRHLILEMGYSSNHPLVNGYDYHLYMTTAHAELQRAFEQMEVITDVRDLVRACFMGCKLNYTHPLNTQVATSLAYDYEERDSKDDNGWSR